MAVRIRRRRHELLNITTLGDVNERSISGHVQHPPVLQAIRAGEHVYEFVLTHTTLSLSGRWELQRYDVQAYGQLGEHYATTWHLPITTSPPLRVRILTLWTSSATVSEIHSAV